MVEAINEALANVPRERVRMHVCWGNYEGPHDQDVPLADVLPIVRRMNVGGFVLPFGNARHAHEYRCFEQAAARRRPGPGGRRRSTPSPTSSSTPKSSPTASSAVAAAVGDPRRVLAGTDCGLETSAGNSRVAEDVAWGKLAALVEGARIASRRLFGA